MMRAFNTVLRRYGPFLGLFSLALLIIVQVAFYFEQRATLAEVDQRVAHSENIIDQTRALHEIAATGIKDGKKANHDALRKQADLIKTALAEEMKQYNNVDNFYALAKKYFDEVNALSDAQPYEKISGNERAHRAMMLYEINQARDNIIAIERQNLRIHRPAAQRHELRLINILLITIGVTYVAVLMAFIAAVAIFMRAQDIKAELEKKDAHFRAAADGSINAFLLFSKHENTQNGKDRLVLEYLNKTACRMWGLTEDDLGRSIHDLFADHYKKAEAIEKVYYETFRSGKARENTYEIAKGSLAGRSVWEQVVPMPNGIAVMARDITESKQVERMKNEFISIVSHELRTPLTSIRGSLGLVMGGIAGNISDQAKDLVTIAYNNCERLVRLINDILDIEKIESGRMAFESRPLSVYPLLRQSIQDNQGYADRYGIRFELEEPKDKQAEDLKIYADADRVAQILTNLLSNAAKFSPHDSVVSLRCFAQGVNIRFEVRDKGQGIPEEFQKHVFEKFAQADGSDSRQKGGTGLGLSIVKAIVEEMKGDVGFETGSDKGTMFYFTLPVPVADPIIAPIQKLMATSDCQRILVCEDDADIASLLLLIFERIGLEVDLATSAKDALELLQKKTYMAMTLDLMLPDKDGVTFVRELREKSQFQDLPIIVISIKAEEGRHEMGGDAIGIVDWLVKPIDVKRLVGLVQRLRLGRPRILHVEDDIGLAEVLRLSLLSVADVIWAKDFNMAKEKIMADDFDLAVVDVGLPDGVGTDLLPYLGGQGRKPVPVILFTASEVPLDVSTRVAAALVKSRTSEEKLLDTIQRIITDSRTDLTRKDAA